MTEKREWFKNKIEIPEDDPKEVIYEVVTRDDKDAGFGLAVADITESAPHYHSEMTEVYSLVSGRVVVKFGGEQRVLLSPGDTIVIPPDTVHSAKTLQAGPARVAILSLPPWSPEDHILVEEHS